ncbi:DMT family transporter [Mycobacterium sp. 1274761.0]|uniref:DMT family transporter n=1 Tax=Mycobacterium sp. 1274761.0 TaxID=1834077 RepID=UPI0007FD3ED6|nr:DMT family transporter [Mycobacterium sp. 1274761.0]OBK73551.1 multidrug DMT transporter permease [Mycobacterium sp. 1274761.0]
MKTIDRIELRWHLGLVVGATSASASAVLLGLADTSPATATAARCLLALPVVAVLALREQRHHGALGRSGRLAGMACGVLFAGDMLWWTQSIPEVGAGLSTVLVNAQIAVVPLLSWLFDGERVGPRFVGSLPVIIAGVLLAGGVFERGVNGSNPTWGTVHSIAAALCYSGFLFLLRRGGQGGQPLQTYAVVLASATITAVAVGSWWHGIDVTPGWPTIAWLILVTVTGQLLGWMLVAFCSPRLPSDVSSALLMLMPIGAVVLGALVLSERPSALQLAGCALVLVASYAATARR